jgi:hypothetical protein
MVIFNSYVNAYRRVTIIGVWWGYMGNDEDNDDHGMLV